MYCTPEEMVQVHPRGRCEHSGPSWPRKPLWNSVQTCLQAEEACVKELLLCMGPCVQKATRGRRKGLPAPCTGRTDQSQNKAGLHQAAAFSSASPLKASVSTMLGLLLPTSLGAVASWPPPPTLLLLCEPRPLAGQPLWLL